MPKIPDSTELGPRALPSAQRGVTRDPSGQIIAGAIQQAGEVLSRKAQVMEQKRDGVRYNAAKSALAHAHYKISRELENVQDYTTWQQMYQDQMAKARDEASKIIRDQHDRSLFEMDAGLDIERGVEKIRGQASKREVDEDRAGIQGMMEDNRTLILESDDPDLQQRVIEYTKAGIKGALDKGSISAQEAEHMDREWTRDTATGMLAMMPADQRAALLANPEGTLAEALAPDVRAKMRQQALEENKVTRNRVASQAESDRIMGQYGSDLSSALTAARKITDPDVRELTVNDVKSRFNEIQAIRSEEERVLFEDAANLIESGNKVTDIAPGDWAKLSVPQRQALETRQRQVMTAEEPIHDDNKYYEWTQLPIEEQGKANLLEWRPYFDDSHYGRAVARQRSILDAKEGGEKQAVLTSAMTTDQRIERTLIASGIPKPTAKNASGVKRWSMIQTAIAERIEQHSESVGRKLNPQEIQQHVDDVILDRYYIDEPWYRKDSEVLGIELTPEKSSDAYVPYDEIPEQARTRLENYARSLGLRPNEDKIAKAYAAGKLRLGDDEILERLR